MSVNALGLVAPARPALSQANPQPAASPIVPAPRRARSRSPTLERCLAKDKPLDARGLRVRSRVRGGRNEPQSVPENAPPAQEYPQSAHAAEAVVTRPHSGGDTDPREMCRAGPRPPNRDWWLR